MSEVGAGIGIQRVERKDDDCVDQVSYRDVVLKYGSGFRDGVRNDDWRFTVQIFDRSHQLKFNTLTDAVNFIDSLFKFRDLFDNELHGELREDVYDKERKKERENLRKHLSRSEDLPITDEELTESRSKLREELRNRLREELRNRFPDEFDGKISTLSISANHDMLCINTQLEGLSKLREKIIELESDLNNVEVTNLASALYNHGLMKGYMGLYNEAVEDFDLALEWAYSNDDESLKAKIESLIPE